VVKLIDCLYGSARRARTKCFFCTRKS